jgi:hypothetical protein
MRSAAANPSMRLGRFLFGFFLIWGALYASGAAQGASVAYGLLALAITGAVAALWEHFAFATPARALLGSLGLGRPTGRSGGIPRRCRADAASATIAAGSVRCGEAGAERTRRGGRSVRA